ncbi:MULTISPECIES: helix-turn-helix domain-containing protein [Brucella]|uniref:helix-turn-helix domain-containing protein n=1 Tax=Brucella/Ochrobactrum group TaxID=2826938 RepID=UPI0009A1D6B7|nr:MULTISPECIES: helix-turn-helix domain-containing protein [Brucella]MQP38767.1 helix-turn-helix domain-containing protein [Ochrobactrum sp. MYb237]QWK78631.1 helix-turn-helix domain-containing protein [Ochrobactrum sp. BTU1]PQZ43386.1 hypothetical protein CQ059_05500 [Brucella pseudogrignonensis]PRA43133.1 hypothetical protein CQ063_01985 [Brucella pseudogrignonensis]PRA72397.1 hypothetical protein CQ055_03595 [Brucella pseudogrignonensis]
MSKLLDLPPKELRRRAIIARGVLDIHAALRKFQDSPAMTMTILAVALGWYEGRPLDTSGVARIASLPRTTVTRHLKALEAEGFLRFSRTQRWVFPIPRNTAAVVNVSVYDDLELIITRTGRELTKLDT